MKELLSIKDTPDALKSHDVDSVLYHDDLSFGHYSLRPKMERHCLGNSNDARGLGQSDFVKTGQREEDMARHDQAGWAMAVNGIGRQGIISGHMGVDNIDLMLFDEPLQGACAL